MRASLNGHDRRIAQEDQRNGSRSRPEQTCRGRKIRRRSSGSGSRSKKIAEEYAKNSRAQFEKITAEATAAADEEYAREVEKAEAECAILIENNEKRVKELAAALLGRVKDGDL